MKVKINKMVRIALIVSTVISTLILSVLIYREYTIPVFNEEKIQLYSYSHDGDINYNVFLKPNILYNEPSLSEGNVYFTELVDYVDASFSYKFKCDKLVNFKGDYEIIAYLQGYETIRSDEQQTNTVYVLWQKEFPMTQKTSFYHNKNQASIKESIHTNYWEYKNMADEIINSLKVNMPTRLSVVMNINIKADTPEDIIENKLTQLMEIPLDSNHFTITKYEIDIEPEIIEETIKTELPPNSNKLTIYYVLIAVMVLMFILLLVFTTGAEGQDPYIIEINKIFKKYGNRLIAVKDDGSISNLSICKVHSMDDLVRFSDEMGKPIIYHYKKDPMEITEFYIIDNSLKYSFNKKESFEQSNKEPEFLLSEQIAELFPEKQNYY